MADFPGQDTAPPVPEAPVPAQEVTGPNVAVTAANDLADAQHTVAVATDLAESLRGMTDQMARLTRTTRRSRGYIIVLAVSLTLDLLLTAGLVYNTVRQNTTATINRTQCLQFNTARMQDIAIWDRLLNTAVPTDPAGKKEVADLKRLVLIKDTPRPC